MSECVKCGNEIKWENINGKWICYNPDGTEHWDLCSEYRTREVIKKGKAFVDKAGSGYIYNEKKKYMLKRSKVIGKVKSTYDGLIPPWEFSSFISCVE